MVGFLLIVTRGDSETRQLSSTHQLKSSRRYLLRKRAVINQTGKVEILEGVGARATAVGPIWHTRTHTHIDS